MFREGEDQGAGTNSEECIAFVIGCQELPVSSGHDARNLVSFINAVLISSLHIVKEFLGTRHLVAFWSLASTETPGSYRHWSSLSLVPPGGLLILDHPLPPPSLVLLVSVVLEVRGWGDQL